MMYSMTIVAQTKRVNIKNNSGNVSLRDMEVNNIYPALDSTQVAIFENSQIALDSFSAMILDLAKKIAIDKKYVDSVIYYNAKLAEADALQKRLIAINDSLMNTIDRDSIVYSQLLKRYNYLLKDELSDLWQRYPDFNPGSNADLVQFLENVNRRKFYDVASDNCNSLDVPRGSNIRRDYSHCWAGIGLGNVYYLFEYNTGGWGTMGITKKSINEMTVTVKGIGTQTVAELKNHYHNYTSLLRNKEFVLDRQYSAFIKDPTLTMDELSKL